jgi:hypothetical protein
MHGWLVPIFNHNISTLEICALGLDALVYNLILLLDGSYVKILLSPI